MNTPSSKSSPPPTPAARRGCFPNGCVEWFVVAFVLFVLVGSLLPLFGRVQSKGSQVRSLAQAKSIGLALRLFAGDHDGKYPRRGVPVEVKDEPENANEAYACLFPTYTQSETIFSNRLSAYQTRTPDNQIDDPFVWKPVKTLQPGENVYGYIMGLSDESRPDAPLIVEGTDGSRHYKGVARVRGGLWEGKKAVVVRLDNSAALEVMAGPERTRYIPRVDDRAKNLLDVEYWGKNVRYLDPAVDANAAPVLENGKR